MGFSYLFVGVIYTFRVEVIFQIYVSQVVSLNLCLTCHLQTLFLMSRSFKFWCKYFLCPKKSFPFQSHKYILWFLLKLHSLSFYFQVYDPSWNNYYESYEVKVKIIFFYMDILLFFTLCWRLSFSHSVVLLHLLKGKYSYNFVPVVEFAVMFHLSVFLSYAHTALSWLVSLYLNLEVG